MEILSSLVALGYITKNNDSQNYEENKHKQLYIDSFQTSAFNNLMYENYKKKLFSKVSDNYFESIKPNTTIINKEWRYQNSGYKKEINDIMREKINDDLMSLENFENINNKKTLNYYIIVFIIIISIIAIFLKKK